MKSEWITVRAADFVYFNPRVSIKKNYEATKISMDKLRPFMKRVPSTERAVFSGGSKFCNGDTIMARITPCLENGKTAFVDVLADGEVGFGSTEFIVMRAVPGVSDPQFVYYLATSPGFRNVAIKSMVGSTGRQRVQQGVLDALELTVPPLIEQQQIGGILADIDKKIQINEEINDNLSEIIQSLYQELFGVTADSPLRGKLSDICCYSKGRIAISDLTLSTYFSTENMQANKAGAVNATSLPTTAFTTKCSCGDVLVSNIRPYFKKIVYCHNECGCSADVLCFTPLTVEMSAFLFSTLYADRFFDYMVAGSKGTKMPRGDKQQIMNYPVAIPSNDDLDAFNAIAFPALAQINANHEENVRLAALREAILPKLMSGEIDVSAIQL